MGIFSRSQPQPRGEANPKRNIFSRLKRSALKINPALNDWWKRLVASRRVYTGTPDHKALVSPADRYVLAGESLGQGAHGEVFIALDSHDNNKQVCLELIPKDKITKYVYSEAINHRLCYHHPHVVQFKEVFLLNEYLVLVMELAGDCTLEQHMRQKGKLPEADARWLFQQLALAVDYIHKRRIACRDIKADNIVINTRAGKRPMLALREFGASKASEDAEAALMAQSLVGTGPYVAPDVLMGQEGYDGMAADMWACGILLYHMLTGKFPFVQPEDRVMQRPMLQRMLRGEFEPPHGASAACLDLLKKLLTPRGGDRITAQDVMRHPWTDMPARALAYNDQLLGASIRTRQTEGDINRVFCKALGLQPGMQPFGNGSAAAATVAAQY